MGYQSILNLYRPEAQAILQFKTLYALEKLHGTSANIAWRDGDIKYFSGGEGYERFVALFDRAALMERFQARFTPADTVTVFGEAYGGKQHGMSGTYGKELRFAAFDVKVGDCWLAVPDAAGLVAGLGLEFVAYESIPATLEAIDAERDRPSVQAVRNGIIEPKIREGVVLRPPFEVRLNNGERLIAKHKRAEFAERATTPVDPSKIEVLAAADAIATEWVTPMRLQHVMDHLNVSAIGMEHIPLIIRAMNEDVSREGAGEIIESDSSRKAIGKRTVKLFKQQLEVGMREGTGV